MANDGAEKQPGRIKQIRMVAKVVRRSNPKAMPMVYAAALGTLLVFVAIGFLLNLLIFMIPTGLLAAAAVGMIVFGQVAQRAQYTMLEGQPGAVASILQSMRGKWTVTPAVQANRNYDMVHRVIGRPGVVLVSEGPSARVGKLIGAEKKRIARAASEVPIYDFQAGDGEGQIPVSKLQRHLMKLPRNLKNHQVNTLVDRFNALPATMQMPKGPMPKTGRMPKMPKPKSR